MLPPLGIAVFVFDRRGSGKSGGKLENSDYTMLADDGISAQRMLAQDHRIDPRRIGFWGLSQGGWLSLLAASRSPQAAFAISISAPMTTPDVQMNFAVANILRIKGFSQSDIDQAIATRTAIDDFQRGKRDRASAQGILDAATTRPWFVHTYLEKTFKDPDQSRMGEGDAPRPHGNVGRRQAAYVCDLWISGSVGACADVARAFAREFGTASQCRGHNNCRRRSRNGDFSISCRTDRSLAFSETSAAVRSVLWSARRLAGQAGARAYPVSCVSGPRMTHRVTASGDHSRRLWLDFVARRDVRPQAKLGDRIRLTP